jgi:hypothetical protein
MGYRNKYGNTDITHSPSKKYGKRFGVLGISWDNFVSQDMNNKRYRIPVFLYTPDMEDSVNHYHIPLTKKQARKLRDWLNLYLKDVK